MSLLSRWHWPDALRAMRHRNYRLYWFGQLISISGSWMQSTAQQWLVYRLTGSPLALGAVAFANTLPALVLSLWAGVVVDRVHKYKLMLVIQVVMMVLAVILTVLTATNVVQYWHVIGLSFLLGIANTFDLPTRNSFTMEITGKEDLTNAVAMNSSVVNSARLIGPAVAGLVVASVGEAMAFFLNALSFLAVIVSLFMMRLPPYTPRPGRISQWADLKEGLFFILRTRVILAMVIIVAVPSMLGFPLNTLMPAMAGDVLHLGPEGFGLLVSALGLGALLGALTLATARVKKGPLLTAATLVYALSAIAFSQSTHVVVACIFLVGCGWGMVTHLATTNTLLQLLTPDALRGRAISAYLWVVVGLAPIGSLILGSLAEALGAPSAILIGASVCLCSALIALVVLPEVRKQT